MEKLARAAVITPAMSTDMAANPRSVVINTTDRMRLVPASGGRNWTGWDTHGIDLASITAARC